MTAAEKKTLATLVAKYAAEQEKPAPAQRKTAKPKDSRTLREVAIDNYYAAKREVSHGKQGTEKHAARAALRKAWGFHAGETAEAWAGRVL